MIDRRLVYKAIDGERAYQDQRWQANPGRTIDEWALYLMVYASELCSLTSHTEYADNWDEKASYLRKIAAMAVAGMEQYGVVERDASKLQV